MVVSNSPARRLAVPIHLWAALLLVAMDLHLIGQYVVLYHLHGLGRLTYIPLRLDIGHDLSLSELLNWGKWLGISLVLFILWAQSRMPTALGFALAFAIVAADDILSLHERGGAALVLWLGLESILGLRAQDVGEVLIWASLAAVIVLAVLISLRVADPSGWRVGQRLLAFLGALVMFGVVVDMVHALLVDNAYANLLLGLVEDGGEMITGSLCLAYCLAQVTSLRPGDTPTEHI